MNKKEFSEALAACANLSKNQALEVTQAVFDHVIPQALRTGEKKITITGFGTLETKRVAARVGRNVKTGESVQIPEKNRVSFKPGKTLKEYVQ